MIDLELHGAKGGGDKPHTPVETPNNLISVAKAKVLIAVAEGELAGRPTNQDIFLDGTPLANPDGSLNFGGVKWEWRSGSVDQDYIQGLPEVSTELNVGVELRDNAPWVRQVTTQNLDAVRVTFNWPALLKQESNGDVNGISMDYAIDLSVNGGAFVEYAKYNITGKTNSGYDRTHRVDIPRDTTIFSIRARRVTPDSQSGQVQDTINVKSYAEVIDVKQRYPNTALLFVEFDSRMFGSTAIPRVSVRTKGRIISVPSNYDPETRTYNGIWAGDFKQAWSDNPAWVYYDMVTNQRFGLGHKVTPAMVDKFALYEVAQYCDVMVDNGKGGLEPRHTCNVYIAQKASAWKVLRDIASIFNGMTYWDGNQFVAVADKEEPTDNLAVFSRSNVVNGQFDYAAADDKSIYTSALVSYDDPDDHFNTQVEAVFEREQILRWGADRQTELSAIGCTSRGEAQRKGRYTLLTNLYNRTVSFQTGLQGLNGEVFPGKLIHVTDPLVGGRQFTGRILALTGTVITLDREVEAKAGDIMYLTFKNGKTEGRTIVSASKNIVQVGTAYTEEIPPGSVWYLEASDLKSQLYRVTKISNPSENLYQIEGVEYNQSKYSAIDNGARLEPRPISVVPSNAQRAPQNVKISSFNYVEQTMAVSSLVIDWDQTPNAVFYEVQWKVGDGDWVNAGITGANQLQVKGIYTGDYVARVRAINAIGIKSIWSNSQGTRLNGKEGAPPTIANMDITGMIFGMRLDWQFREGSTDTLFTQIRYSEDFNFANSKPLGDFSYPTDSHELHGLSAGKRFWFWARLQDRSGNLGPWNPLEGQAGFTGASLDNSGGLYNDYFAGLISETALDKMLYDKVQLIDGNGAGSVNERINEKANEINNRVDSEIERLERELANVTDALVYDPTKTYAKGEIVRQGQKLYQAIGPVPVNQTPPNETYWKDVGTILEDANGLAIRVDLAEENIEIIDGKVASIVRDYQALQAAYRDEDPDAELRDALNSYKNRAQIIVEQVVRADADEALAQRTTLIEAIVDENTAQITTIEKAYATADEALGERIDRVSAETMKEIGELDEKVNVEIAAQIATEVRARTDADSALGERIEINVASIKSEKEERQAAILSEQKTRADADVAIAERVDTVNATIENESKRLDASILEESRARVSADNAIAEDINTVQARIDDEASSRQAAIRVEERARVDGDQAISKRVDTIEAGLITDQQVKALIQVETNARVTADESLAERIDTTQATAGQNSASIQEVRQAQADTDGRVNSAWTLKMEANSNGQYVAAGIGIGIENGPAGLQSQFLVRSDRFAIVAGANGTTTSPFVVEGGQVYINSAMISQATITNAIVGATLVSAAQTNWVGPVVHWNMNSGRLAIHHQSRAYTYTEQDHTGMRVYVDGVLRVRMGTW